MILSIIVPTYNVESYLSNCLDSLINQDITRQDYEIIIVNDGSTDSSPEIADLYGKNFEHVKVQHQENQGLSGARNQGLKIARGKYVLFVDSDDYLASNTLGYLVSVMAKNDLDVLGIGYRHTHDLDQYQSANYSTINTEEIQVTDGITYVAHNPYYTSACFYLINREYLLDLGLTFPLKRYHEDTIFVAKLLICCTKIGNTSLDVYRYFSRPESITNKRSKEHLLNLVDSSVKNIQEMNPVLDWVKSSSHDQAGNCLERLTALQHYWVFLLLVMLVRARVTKKEAAPILQTLTSIGAYPIDKVFLKYNGNFSYALMRSVMNRKNLLYNVLWIFDKLESTIPDFQVKLSRYARKLSQIKT